MYDVCNSDDSSSEALGRPLQTVCARSDDHQGIGQQRHQEGFLSDRVPELSLFRHSIYPPFVHRRISSRVSGPGGTVCHVGRAMQFGRAFAVHYQYTQHARIGFVFVE